MKTIDANNITIGFHNYKKKQNIIGSEINICALEGELVAVIGKNGIGKSTLLKTIARLQPLLNGKLYISGNEQNSISNTNYSSLVSYVSTEIIKIPNFSIYHLVALGRFPYTNWLGTLSEYDNEIIADAINLVGLNSLKHRTINELSDGERQRAMIARALAQDTQIIILDEPTAYLDIQNKYEIIHLLSRLVSKKNKTIIFSTHDLNIAVSESDKIWLMNENKILQGAPEDLILQNSFDGMFDNQLKFDWRSGLFKSHKQFQKTIKIESDDLKLTQITMKALIRNGFSVHEDADLVLKISQNLWKLYPTKEYIEFNCIYDLCTYLKNNFPK